MKDKQNLKRWILSAALLVMAAAPAAFAQRPGARPENRQESADKKPEAEKPAPTGRSFPAPSARPWSRNPQQ